MKRQGMPYPRAMNQSLFGYEQTLSEQSFIAKSNLNGSSGRLRPCVFIQHGKFQIVRLLSYSAILNLKLAISEKNLAFYVSSSKLSLQIDQMPQNQS